MRLNIGKCTLRPAFGVWLACAALCGAAAAKTLRFDKMKPGTTPPDWTVAMTHEGGAPKWEVVEGAGARGRPRVLAQTSSDATNGRFPLAIYEKAAPRDGRVSVKFRTVSGEKDQAAGIVWRYKDPDNYYVVRANALEDNVVLYKVQAGKRVPLAPKGTPEKTYGVKHVVPKQTWCALRVSFQGSHFEVFFNGQKIMEVDDATFAEAGKTGLWTKADSVTQFEDFEVKRR